MLPYLNCFADSRHNWIGRLGALLACFHFLVALSGGWMMMDKPGIPYPLGFISLGVNIFRHCLHGLSLGLSKCWKEWTLEKLLLLPECMHSLLRRCRDDAGSKFDFISELLIRLVEHMLSTWSWRMHLFDRTWSSKRYMSGIWLRRFSKTSICLHQLQAERHPRRVVLKPFGV